MTSVQALPPDACLTRRSARALLEPPKPRSRAHLFVTGFAAAVALASALTAIGVQQIALPTLTALDERARNGNHQAEIDSVDARRSEVVLLEDLVTIRDLTAGLTSTEGFIP